MDTTYGVLCLIPPIVAIGLALWTKQTIFSLFIAVFSWNLCFRNYRPYPNLQITPPHFLGPGMRKT